MKRNRTGVRVLVFATPYSAERVAVVPARNARQAVTRLWGWLAVLHEHNGAVTLGATQLGRVLDLPR